MKKLIALAHLAPSTRNTKPWILQLEKKKIVITPDNSRWLPIDDPDKRQVYLSIGCVLENLLIGLASEGWKVNQENQNNNDQFSIHLHLISKGKKERSPFLEAIERRYTYRGFFSPKKIPSFEPFQKIGGKRLLLSEDDHLKKAINELCIQGDIALLSSPDFCKELMHLSAKMEKCDTFFIQKLQVLAERLQGISAISVMETAPVVGLLLVEKASPLHWIECGQRFERIFLEVTRQGLCLKPYSICLREEEDRKKVGALFKVSSGVPAFLFCIGFST